MITTTHRQGMTITLAVGAVVPLFLFGAGPAYADDMDPTPSSPGLGPPPFPFNYAPMPPGAGLPPGAVEAISPVVIQPLPLEPVPMLPNDRGYMVDERSNLHSSSPWLLSSFAN
jgi:hypothetical protein